jgi:exodeoxyribonuclease-1
MARLIAERTPDLWKLLLANRDKGHVRAQLEPYAPLELIGRFGGGPPKAIMGCLCGYADNNPNQAYLFDLDAVDPQDLINASDADLMAAMDSEPRLLRSISVNKVPVLLPPATVTDEHRRRARVLAEAPELRRRLITAMTARYATVFPAEPQPVEEQIFNGFYDWNDKAGLKEFQRADWRRRQEIVAEFQDARLRQLGRRLLAFYAPKLLSVREQRQYSDWRRARWDATGEDEVKWMTLVKARQAISEMKSAGLYDLETLTEIEDFIDGFRFAADEQG